MPEITRRELLAIVSFGVAGFALSGCSVKPDHAVSHYFGKNRQEIIEILGEPSTIDPDSREGSARAMALQGQRPPLYYRLDDKALPKPLRELEFLFSDAGLCHQISGITKDYNTPEEVLTAIGLGSLDKKVTSTNQLGSNYSILPFEIVQINRPSSFKKYSSFNVYDREAG